MTKKILIHSIERLPFCIDKNTNNSNELALSPGKRVRRVSWPHHSTSGPRVRHNLQKCFNVSFCIRERDSCYISCVFFSHFNALIGDLNELREKDYGDEARGAQR